MSLQSLLQGDAKNRTRQVFNFRTLVLYLVVLENRHSLHSNDLHQLKKRELCNLKENSPMLGASGRNFANVGGRTQCGSNYNGSRPSEIPCPCVDMAFYCALFFPRKGHE